MSSPERPKCPGHGRHWFTVYGMPTTRSPVCVRCGATNPRPLSEDEWDEVIAVGAGSSFIRRAIAERASASSEGGQERG